MTATNLAIGNRANWQGFRRTHRSSHWLRVALVEAALGDAYLPQRVAVRYLRIRRHSGRKRAVVAVAHSMLITAHHLVTGQSCYHELGRITTTSAR